MVAIAIGLTMGASVLISQKFGAGKYDEMKRTIAKAWTEAQDKKMDDAK